jgi:hypothetical protein
VKMCCMFYALQLACGICTIFFPCLWFTLNTK